MVNFLDLQKINAQYRDALIGKSTELIDSGWYIQGTMVKTFEKELALYIGVKYAIGVANGLDALTLIFRANIALGRLQVGDKILVPANTYIASILAISACDLVPVLVEPDSLTFNLSVDNLKKMYTSEVKGILNVHLYGRVSWSVALEQFIQENKLLCFEDNAQAIGATYQGRKTGSLGDAAGFSFYPGKNLGCLGDGGAVTTNDEELARMIRMLGNYGSEKKYENKVKGVNSRLDELQAGFLSVKLPFLDEENEKRRCLAEKYVAAINKNSLILPELPEDRMEHVWHLFVVRSKERESLQQYLQEAGIQTLIHYPIPPHKQMAYAEWNDFQLLETEAIHREVLSLPMSPVLSSFDQQKVIESLNTFV